MTVRNMQYNDKVDFQDTATFSDVPSGSVYTTCKTFFTAKQSSDINTDARCCINCRQVTSPCGREIQTENETGLNNLQYFELVPKVHKHHCALTNTSSLTFMKKVRWFHFNYAFNSTLFLQKNFSFSVTKTFLLMCLISSIILCAKGAPAPKTSAVKSSSLNDEKNLTSSQTKFDSNTITTQEKTSVDVATTKTDGVSTKIKRSSGVRHRSKKGPSNRKKRKRTKGNKKNKKLRRKHFRKKGRRQRRPVQKTVPFPSEVIHRKPNRHEILASPRRQRLYNKNGNSFHLAIWRDGSISGEDSATRSNNSILEIRGVGAGGRVTIMGVAAKRFVCVTKKGVVKTRKKYKKSRCQFREKILLNNQNTYESLSCKGCFLNLNKKGRVRKLKGANPKLTQSHFLPLKIGELTARKLPNYLPARKGKILSIDFSNFNETEKEVKSFLADLLPESSDEKENDDVSKEAIDVTVPSLQILDSQVMGKPKHLSKFRILLKHHKFVKKLQKSGVVNDLGEKSKGTPTLEARDPAGPE